MKNILLLLSPLLLAVLACGAQSQPAQDLSVIVNATLTALAQSNTQAPESQATFTSIPIQAQPSFTSIPIQAQPSPTVAARDFIPPLGTVIASLSYPASALPRMRVVFFSLFGDSPSYTDTALGQNNVSMDLPAGSYHVVAYSLAGGGFPGGLAGGYTQAVPCGLSAACTDHSLLEVNVVAGTTITISPGDWYVPDGTFPPMPNP
jgi:hypothetical protein